MEKHVYSFEEGKKEMKELLGGKGANLAEMTGLGLPVPPGFTITTKVCDYYNKNNKKYPSGMMEQVDQKLTELEKKMGKKLGDENDPLLLSVRSGAAISMPGMMDTVLNLGLNDKSVLGLIKKTGNEWFSWDSYRRLIQMFGDVVMGVEHTKFEKILEKTKETRGVEYDTDLTVDDLKKVVEGYKQLYKKEIGSAFPQDPKQQLKHAIDAVFGSWGNSRAIAYRRINKIRGLLGTAVNVQVMAFGNMGNTSGTGVLFTRDPSTGENRFYGEYLINAQGEDVVAGIRTPQEVTTLKKVLPKVYDELVAIYKKVENHYRDMQDMEFTIQEGKLFILQTRTGKRTAKAALKIATDLVKEGLITEKEAVMRVDPNQLDQLLHKQLDPIAKSKAEKLARGLPASPGAAVGIAVFTADKAAELGERGDKVILVRTETSPEDIEGMHASQGFLTARGGMTSHAAVVARGMGKPCVAGCQDIIVKEEEGYFKAGNVVIKEGDYITLDGSLGVIFKGKIPVVDPELSGDFEKLMKWADKHRTMGVRANAETPHDAQVARGFGAEGIGLCRTEHMFFDGERIQAVREMILSKTLEGRKKALGKLLPMQKNDFKELFKIMKGLPVTIRLLDPPLHEFLPREEQDIKIISKELGVSVQDLKDKISMLHEFNPMLGHRGVRLAVTYPEIAEMQVEAIIRAAVELKKEGQSVVPEIMIPLVGHVGEFTMLKRITEEKIKEILDETKTKLEYSIGTMIEVPRAALTADEIAEHAEFFSFGTNDLTQMGFGLSRDDVGSFIPHYVEIGLLPEDPFQVLDQEGIGQLVEIAVKKGKKVKPKLKVGICGEHGGEPASVKFCHRTGLNYVSCSPFRIPIARLAAAQAALESKK